MSPIQPQPPPNAPTTIAKTLFTVTGKVALLLPATSRPHCFYLATSMYLKPVARELSLTPSSLTEKELFPVDCMAIPTMA